MEDAANEGQDRTGKGVARTTMADAFAANAIFLVREGEVD
jgi:hypothetical protein